MLNRLRPLWTARASVARPLVLRPMANVRWQHTPVAKSERKRKEQDKLEEKKESVEEIEETEKIEETPAEKSTETESQEDEKSEIHDTGVIETKEKERLLYFDNIIFPTPSFLMGEWSPSWILTRSEKRVKTVIEKYAVPEGLNVDFKSVVLRPKDGGAFVTYSMQEHTDKYSTPRDAEAAIIKQLKKSDFRPWFHPFRACRVFTVKGVPWIEDLRRIPSRTLKVWFEGPSLSQEELYSLFRRYGYIDNIVSPDPASKDPVVYAEVIYGAKASSTTAKNCLNGMSVNDTTILHITFAEQQTKLAYLKDFITNHTRISIPILLALLATVSLWIFDPIRKQSVKNKVHPIINLENNLAYKQLKKVVQPAWTWFLSWVVIHPRPNARKVGTQLHQLWPERLAAINDVKQWLQENVNTFIVVSGPRGSGKQELVLDYVLSNRDKVLPIDCAELVKARNDSEFITKAAHQLGYFPVFPWMNNISSFIDLAIQGLTGQKGGFSESTEAQFKSMLAITSAAINDVALSNHNKEDHAKNQITRNIDYLQSHPEAKPVVVIEHFLARTDRNQFVYKHLAEWAASLIQSNSAHVIFVTSDVSFQKVLSVALPNQIFKTVHAGDASAESAREFVKQQMDEFKRAIEAARHVLNQNGQHREYETKCPEPKEQKEDVLDEIIEDEKDLAEFQETTPKHTVIKDHEFNWRNLIPPGTDESDLAETPIPDLSDLEESLGPLGGRMTDLQAFIRRLKSGDTPREALRGMITQSATEIVQMFLMRDNNQWSKEQVWCLMKKLANDNGQGVSLANLMITEPLFKGALKSQGEAGESTIASLERSEMVTIINKDGRPTYIKVGKPLYRAAFQYILSDKTFSAMMEAGLLESQMKVQSEKIVKLEEELRLLAKFPQNWGDNVNVRVKYLVSKLAACQDKIQKYELQLLETKKTFSKKDESKSWWS